MQNEIDAALLLRMNIDDGVNYDIQDAIKLLKSSKLIHKLTSDFIPKPLYAIWRIIALSEIPFTSQLDVSSK